MDDLRHHHQPIPPPPLAASNSAAAPWAFLWEPPQEVSGIAAEELKQALLRTTLELESTRIAAQEELRQMESQALNLTHLLEIATRERDEARHQCHALLLLLMDHNNNLAANTNPNPNPNQAAQLDEGSNAAVGAGGLSSSSSEGGGEEERSNGTSPAGMAAVDAEMEAAARRRGLPEKGRLLEAVMAAGPLLQTLLLAGPLPQWRHPPPALQTFEIPPVSIGLLNNNNNNNATTGDMTAVAFCGGRSPPPSPPSLRNSSSSSPETESNSSGVSKFQRIRSFHL